jgi:hypothetical protein
MSRPIETLSPYRDIFTDPFFLFLSAVCRGDVSWMARKRIGTGWTEKVTGMIEECNSIGRARGQNRAVEERRVHLFQKPHRSMKASNILSEWFATEELSRPSN